MLLRIFGDALFYPATNHVMKEFPSPEDLKGRIIVSTKPPKEYLEAAPAAKSLAQNKGVVNELQKEDKQKEPLSDKVANLHINEVDHISQALFVSVVENLKRLLHFSL